MCFLLIYLNHVKNIIIRLYFFYFHVLLDKKVSRLKIIKEYILDLNLTKD